MRGISARLTQRRSGYHWPLKAASLLRPPTEFSKPSFLAPHKLKAQVGLIYDGISLNIRPAGCCIVLLPQAVSAPQTSKKQNQPGFEKWLVNRSVVLWEILWKKIGIGFLKEFMLGSVPQKNKKVSSYKGQREIEILHHTIR